MTVSELIEALKKHPPDMRVIINGYEGGYEDVWPASIRKRRIALNIHEPEFFGPHDDEDYEPEEPHEIVDAVLIERDT